MDRKETTEEKILRAARATFHKKGMEGARMQEIADRAGINKAMLHYYFRNKKQLFESVFMEDFRALAPELIHILSSDQPLFEKIKTFADRYITLIQSHPYLPVFILSELSREPQKIVDKVAGSGIIDPKKFIDQVREEANKGKIRQVDPLQLMVNLVSMCIFPFIGKPMLKVILKLDEFQFQQLLEERKKQVPEFIIRSLKKD